MTFEFIGKTLQMLGEVMIGFTAVIVHYRVWKEHKISAEVFKEMHREQMIGIIGIILIILGYLAQINPSA